MEKFALGATSRANLAGVHPILREIIERAIQITSQDFRVTEGLRSYARQEQLFKAKLTKTMNSRHLSGYAVDLVPVGVNDVWNRNRADVLAAWLAVSDAVHQAAAESKITIRWGGDFNGDGFGVGNDDWDLPHFELPIRNYP
jgi:peptidoglycan L-alanyl-D-glutamate endopeptidase CwlK